MHASRLAPQRHRAADSAAGACGMPGQDTLLLLLPVKRASDIIYGARYARRLQEWGIKVRVNLLHVTPAPPRQADGLPRHGSSACQALDLATQQMMHEAGLYLSRSDLAFSTHIFAGELLFTILDTAELLGCHEIVLPALRHSPWQRRFASALARKLARATRSATVLLADTDGMSGPPPA
ncbi:universal stress protein [Janthinobacterium sp. FW305-129]|uniref:universal stress protein n=1 Tax=Janthinobacterium sp. FW305-129 TaxID=2775054 RepID=UPI001E38F7F8|nr:universal stress protein [Janthinobacterium sp. FW305-129]MCC7598317.1 universal stress protein [Janthinobacterium sp. FW305-129]